MPEKVTKIDSVIKRKPLKNRVTLSDHFYGILSDCMIILVNNFAEIIVKKGLIILKPMIIHDLEEHVKIMI